MLKYQNGYYPTIQKEIKMEAQTTTKTEQKSTTQTASPNIEQAEVVAQPMTQVPTQLGQSVLTGDMQAFINAQRRAKLLSECTIGVPDTFKGNVANCVIALEMAERMGASPLAVMQSMYVIHGRPSWSAQFIISCINASGRFSPLRYEFEGEGDKRTCYAWATDRTGQKLKSPTVSIAMAIAEGWATKNGSKWKTMPDLMLSYRAATFFGRLYAPEILMGMQTEDEVRDVTASAEVETKKH
jgi:hypothetical protein